MTKEEILEQSRKENNDKDVFDLEVQKTAARAAFFSSFGLCAFVSILSWIFTKHVSVQCWMIFFGMLTVAFGVKFFKMKKLHEDLSDPEAAYSGSGRGTYICLLAPC